MTRDWRNTVRGPVTFDQKETEQFQTHTVEPLYPDALGQLRRDTEVQRGEPCFRCLKFALHLDSVHCSTKLSVWAGEALPKLRLHWLAIMVGNRSTVDMYFIWPHLKKTEPSLSYASSHLAWTCNSSNHLMIVSHFSVSPRFCLRLWRWGGRCSFGHTVIFILMS